MFRRCIAVWTLVWVTALVSGQDDLEAFRFNIRTAIEKGRDYLLKSQKPDGTWEHPGKVDPTSDETITVTALCATALMEAGLKANHESVKKAERVIRAAIARSSFTQTACVYHVTLFIRRLYHDRGFADADKLFRKLVDVLIQAQGKNGDWGIQLTGTAIDRVSTAQALCTLWVAREFVTEQKGIDKAISAVAANAGKGQQPDGGWAAERPGQVSQSSGSATWAELLIIAIPKALEVARSREDLYDLPIPKKRAKDDPAHEVAPLRDIYPQLDENAQVKRGLAFLGEMLVRLEKQHQLDEPPLQFLHAFNQGGRLFRLRTVNKEDWHRVGSNYLLPKQQVSGAWNLDAKLGEPANTAYGLLFLTKSSLIRPLAVARFS